MSGSAGQGRDVMAGRRPTSVMGALRDRWEGFRAGLVADPRFRRFAAGFFLTRPVARRRTRHLFDLAAGFVYSQVLAAFVRLELVSFLHGSPRTLALIAGQTGLSEDRASRLMRAAVALGLAAEGADGRYRLGETGAALVDNDGVLAMIAHHAMLYEDLADPVSLLRGERETGLSRFWSYAGGETDDARAAEDYSRLMARSQGMIARDVLDALPLKAHRRLLDIGGGSGAFAMEAARRHAHLSIELVDLPQVAKVATRRIAQAGLAGRIAVHEGSFLDGPLPRGADIVTLNRVLHDHDDAAAVAILRAAHAALPPGGRIAIAEPMAGTRGAEPAGDAYFGFYLLAMGQGRPRRFDEIAATMKEAGFGEIREPATPTPLIVRVATGRRGAA